MLCVQLGALATIIACVIISNDIRLYKTIILH